MNKDRSIEELTKKADEVFDKAFPGAGESMQEIRDRRQKEFDRKLQLGIPIEQPKYPAYVELMDARGTIKKLLADNAMLIAEVIESEAQIKKLQEDCMRVSKLMLSANNRWLESCTENRELKQEIQTQEDVIIELGEMDEHD